MSGFGLYKQTLALHVMIDIYAWLADLLLMIQSVRINRLMQPAEITRAPVSHDVGQDLMPTPRALLH